MKAAYDAALAQMKAGALFEAMEAFERIAARAPKAPEPRFQLGRLCLAVGRPRSAVSWLEAARALAPSEQAIWKPLAEAHAAVGDPEAAAELHRARAKAAPGDLGPPLDRALVLQQAGQFDAAEAIFRKLWTKAKAEPEFYRLWFAGRRVDKPGEPALKAAEKLWTHPRLNAHGRMHLGFALAKVMGDLGRHDRVFPYLDAANAAQAGLAPYDRAAREAEVAETRRIAQSGAVARRGGSDAAPIFVVGMPRSGTTLVERILAAHSQVRAGGEIAQVRPTLYRTVAPAGALPEIAQIPVETLDLFADRYWSVADETAPGAAPRITDKSMQTQLILGVIAAALPRARFIVVRRDPRDIALSIYRNYFKLGAHRYATRLADIAHQMRTFEESLAAWRDRVPMTEICYEDLVADPEGQSRALVAAAGLDWEEGCLDHRASATAVKTISIAQVRQPIYTSSSGGWRRFETELQPFIDAWEAGQ